MVIRFYSKLFMNPKLFLSRCIEIYLLDFLLSYQLLSKKANLRPTEVSR